MQPHPRLLSTHLSTLRGPRMTMKKGPVLIPHPRCVISSDLMPICIAFPNSFKEWLAGVLDGDGNLRLMKKKYPELSITMGSGDFPLLEYVKRELGTGGIYEVARAKAYRYIISNREGMRKVIQCINGLIRNSVRLPQLRRVCAVLDIPFFAPLELTEKSNWFSGFFDADGTVGIHGLPKRAPKIMIRVSNKFESDLAPFFLCFGGGIYYNKSNDVHEWVVSKRTEVMRLLAYYNSSMFKSRKSRRFMLIDEFYRLRDHRAYRENSILHSDWLDFKHRWDHFLG